MNKELMHKVHLLKQILTNFDINLDGMWPNFVVLGDQSVGKSSMLEMVLQLEIFPRGEKRVTTRPIVVTTIQKENQETPLIEFVDTKEKFLDINEARERIRNNMIDINQNLGGVSKAPLRVAVYSKNVVDLTFVDIPGLIMTSNYGEGLKTGIEELAESYCANPNYIILACYCAATDPDTSSALSIAKKHDPDGDRTFGIITKCDGLIDEGAVGLITGLSSCHTLKYGYCATVGRDTKKGSITIDQAIEHEKRYFLKHPTLKDSCDLLGTQNLRNRLSELLREKTINVMPKITRKLEVDKEKCIAFKKKLQNAMGMKEGEDADDVVCNLIKFFTLAYQEHMDGKDYRTIETELTGEAKILAILQEGFEKHVDLINPLEKFSDKRIQMYIRQRSGYTGGLYPSERGAEAILEEIMPNLIHPCSAIINEVKNKIIESINIVSQNGKLDEYTAFKKWVIYEMKELVEANFLMLMKTVEHNIYSEKYINFDHSNFKMVEEL